MKKIYNKPSMEIERFELTQQLASCSGVQVHYTSTNCVLKGKDHLPSSMYDLAAANFFMGDACTLSATILNEHDGICYNTAFNMAFTS